LRELGDGAGEVCRVEVQVDLGGVEGGVSEQLLNVADACPMT